MLALIDADIVIYRVAWTTEHDDPGIAKWRCDEMLDNILIDTKASKFSLWLSDSAENNFRYGIYPEYKANRKDQPRPRHLEYLKEHVIRNWGARFALEQEADDALGIEQEKHNEYEYSSDVNLDDSHTFIRQNECTSTICSIDKDLLQIPGNHYNFVKKEHSFVTPEQGIRAFYTQILVGDTADNIRGCTGIGPVKANRAIGAKSDPSELLEIVCSLYCKQESTKTEEENIRHILQIGKLLKIRTFPEEVWSFPLTFTV